MDSKNANAIAAVCAALLPSSTIIKQSQQPLILKSSKLRTSLVG